MKKDNNHIIEELESLKANNLISYKKELPDNYFIDLEENLNNTINVIERKKTKQIFIPFSIAASLLLLIGFYFVSNSVDNSLTWESVKNEEIAFYVLENIEEFSSEEISSFSSENDLSFLFSSSISKNDLENYLLDETADDAEFINY